MLSLKNSVIWFIGAVLMVATITAEATLVIPMYSVSSRGQGIKLGTIKADDTLYGVIFTPNLRYLPPGVHGFHVHVCGLCSNYGLDARGHFDPLRTFQHLGPYNGDGHLGDLPVLIVKNDGRATLPVLAPRLRLATIEGRSLIIDEGSDNYSDEPVSSGGGGARIACGVIGYPH